MKMSRAYLAVGAIAFLAGVVTAGLVFEALREAAEPTVKPSPEVALDPVLPPRAERKPVRGRKAARELEGSDDGVNTETLGVEANEQELAFLRAELAAERIRRKEAAERDAVAEREGTVRADDDGLTILRRYLEWEADVSDVVSDYAAMRQHVRTESGPVRHIVATGERTEVDLTEVAAGHAVLEFGEGVFVLDRGKTAWNVRRDVVTSLEIRGAGMDRTTLIGPGWAFLCADEKGEIRNLVLRDLTIDGVEKGQIVLDARGGIAASLERVRISGWQVAGHAAPLGVSGNAFLVARDCVFAGPGDGFVLSLRGPALALFEQCRFTGARAALISGNRHLHPAIVRLNECVFDGVRLTDRELRRKKTGGVKAHVAGGTASIGASGWTEEQRRQQFGTEHATSIDGLTFRYARAPAFALDDAVRALELAERDGLRLVALEAQPAVRGSPVELDLYVPAEKAGAKPVRRRRIYDGSTLAEPTTEARRGGRNYSEIPPADLARALPLSTLLKRSGIAADEEIKTMSLRLARAVDASGAAQQRMLCMIRLAGRKSVVFDAVTGEAHGR